MMLPTMPDFWSLLNNPSVELLGWTLLHFVWQGVLVAALLAGALRMLNKHSSQVRYVIACATLAGLLALPVGTGLFLAGHLPDTASSPSSSVVAEPAPAVGGDMGVLPATSISSSSTLSWHTQATSWLRPALPWVVLGWGLGVLFFSVRLAGGAWRVRRLRRTGTAVTKKWQNRLRRLTHRLGLRRAISLRQSSAVDSPMVTGWWRPVVLVPTGLITGLPPDQVEALLLHELAHIRRHDVLVGRLQAVVEVLLFFHPATWWISRQVRREREACCDDLVVQAGTERTTYARALTALAERAVAEPQMAWVPAATDGSLLARIRRLLDPSASSSPSSRRLSMVAAVLLLVGVPVGLAACASQQAATETEGVAQASSAPSDSSEQTENRAAIVVEDDSTESKITIRPENPIATDTLPGGTYALRGERDWIDSLKSFSWNEGELNLDSLKKVFRSGTPVDRLARAFENGISADSVEKDLSRIFKSGTWADSLAYEFTRPIEDSTFVFSHDIDVDSLLGWSEHHADSLSQVFERRFADSTVGFNWEEFERDVDVDSLVRWREQHADSLRRHLDSLQQRAHEHADSLQRRMVRLHERQQGSLPEHLRERARRLREQAERLEERAEEMEHRAPTPPDSMDQKNSGEANS